MSDALLSDLTHILRKSRVGATVAIYSVAAYAIKHWSTSQFDPKFVHEMCCVGGDDYELVFTAPPAARAAVQAVATATQTVLTRIGTIESQAGLRLVDAQGVPLAYGFASFDHFKM